MSKLTANSRHALLSEDGPTAVEYAVMLAFIIVICFAVVGSLGIITSGLFNSATSSFSASS